MPRSLMEAAADVLNKSRSDSAKMPMQNLSAVRGTEGIGQTGNTVDLGGATYENPAGGETGKKTAAARSVATPPGVQPGSDTNEPMHKLESGTEGDKAAKSTSDQKAGEVSDPEEHDGAHAASHGSYAHPTNEESELTEEEIEAARAERWEHAKEVMKSLSCEEDMQAMFAGETLSEEFMTKAATIFEAAVIARALTVAETLEEEIMASAEEALADSQVAIEEQVDTYLNFVVENWVQENQVAIETGLRTEIVEDFISGLKNLFAENYIDVPEDKVDVVEEQASEIEALNAQINEVMNANAELSKMLGESKKTEILSTVCEGLTATQAAKVKTLAEGVEFTTEGEYADKLGMIRESYFTAAKTVKQDNTSVIALTESSPAQIEESVTLSSEISQYNDFLNRTHKVY